MKESQCDRQRSTHAGAMLIAALAYRYARRHAKNPRFTFGTGKLGDLAGFASAMVLGLIALLIAWESFLRLSAPVEINFTQAIVVAVIGLSVNVVSAFLLHDNHGHHHGHHHDHDHHHDHHHNHGHDHHPDHCGGARDNNLRAAYFYVLADALISVLAIVALLLGSLYRWIWMDPAMGLVGALVIARWSWGLIRDSGSVRVDYSREGEEIGSEIRDAVEASGDKIADLHVWNLGPGHYGAIVSIATKAPQPLAVYRERLAHVHEISHLTLEVQAA